MAERPARQRAPSISWKPLFPRESGCQGRASRAASGGARAVSAHAGDLALAAIMLCIIGYAAAILIKRIWWENRK